MTNKQTEITDTDIDRIAGGAEFPVNTSRFDPYRTFKFRVESGGSSTSTDGMLLTATDLRAEQDY